MGIELLPDLTAQACGRRTALSLDELTLDFAEVPRRAASGAGGSIAYISSEAGHRINGGVVMR